MNNNISVGWECPKCGKVNAPFVRNCDCHIPTPKDIALPATPGFGIPADKDYKNHCLWDSMPETSEGLIRNRNPEPTKADVGLDRVYSSTGAEPDANKQNVKIGVTAHCRCGNVFIDDIKSGLPKSLRQPTKAENGLVKLDKLKVNAVIKKSFDIENLKKNRYALQYLPETLKELLKAVDEATEEICETFGVPERRVPTVDEMKEYVSKNCKYGCYECGGCGYDDQIIEACHALFARTEEKK